MAIMPGAELHRIKRNFTPKVTRKTAVILHTAASDATGYGHYHYWNTNPAARASSHFYVDYDGTIHQLVDTKHIAWTSGHANPFSIGIETQGWGNEPWTPQQVASLAKILAWCHKTHNIPLVEMTSYKQKRGIGYHRLGVPKNKLALWIDRHRRGGPLLWSSAVGKVCPGAKREAQIPQIIKIAAGNEPAIDEENELNEQQAKQLTAIFDTLTRGQEHVKYNGEIWGLIQDVKATTSRLDQRLARLEAGTVDADILGDPKAKGIANALRRMWRAIEPPAGTDPTQPKGAAWNRWQPWREAIKKFTNKSEQNGENK